MSSYTKDYIENKLKTELNAEHVSICFAPNGSSTVKWEVDDLSDGCGAKFNALIVSAAFDGKPLLQRHRMVNKILEEEMKTIHAFTQKTLTPEQWEKQKSS